MLLSWQCSAFSVIVVKLINESIVWHFYTFSFQVNVTLAAFKSSSSSSSCAFLVLILNIYSNHFGTQTESASSHFFIVRGNTIKSGIVENQHLISLRLLQIRKKLIRVRSKAVNYFAKRSIFDV